MEYLTFWVSLVLLRTKAGLRDGESYGGMGKEWSFAPPKLVEAFSQLRVRTLTQIVFVSGLSP